MESPSVSVILPVFNGAAFLQQAIDSVVQQTLTDVELIIINDGSTDSSEQIILSYKDERIRYFKNEINKGLVFTLNKGIELSRADFIARMDSDDICLSERLYKQKTFLQSNKNTAVVACFIENIDEFNNPLGVWNTDRATTSDHDIKIKMAKENCIAHPSVMMRKEIIQQYLYKDYQKNIEDYDLWLRLLSDGHTIEKIPEVLLQYRLHKQSITKKILQKHNPFLKQFDCKRRFLQTRIAESRFGIFECRTFVSMISNLMMGLAKALKQKIIS